MFSGKKNPISRVTTEIIKIISEENVHNISADNTALIDEVTIELYQLSHRKLATI